MLEILQGRAIASPDDEEVPKVEKNKGRGKKKKKGQPGQPTQKTAVPDDEEVPRVEKKSLIQVEDQADQPSQGQPTTNSNVPVTNSSTDLTLPSIEPVTVNLKECLKDPSNVKEVVASRYGSEEGLSMGAQPPETFLSTDNASMKSYCSSIQDDISMMSSARSELNNSSTCLDGTSETQGLHDFDSLCGCQSSQLDMQC